MKKFKHANQISEEKTCSHEVDLNLTQFTYCCYMFHKFRERSFIGSHSLTLRHKIIKEVYKLLRQSSYF